MKILIYQPRVSYYIGGGEIYPLQMAKFFMMLGHSVTILTTKADYLVESEYFKNFIRDNPNIKVEYLELDLNYKDIYNIKPGMCQTRWDKESIWVSRLAYEFMLKNKYDVISVHYVLDALAVPFKCKCVLHLHGAPDKISDLCRIVLEKQKNLIAVSQKVKNQWIKLGIKKDIQISTNAIDPNVFYPAINAKKDIDILFVGRLIEIKGVQYILKSIKRLQRKNMYPKLVIIGDGPYREELYKLTENLHIEKQVQFRGQVSQKELIESYQKSKCVVLPSIQKEGIMSTLLEAAACRNAIITTTGTSMAEFAKDNQNAILVKPCDDIDLSNKIYSLLNNEELINKISNNAYNEVLKNHTWISKAGELIELYRGDNG